MMTHLFVNYHWFFFYFFYCFIEVGVAYVGVAAGFCSTYLACLLMPLYAPLVIMIRTAASRSTAIAI